MMRSRILWKFLGAYVPLILAAIIVLSFFVSLRLRDYYELKISERLANSAVLISDILRKDLVNKSAASLQNKVKNLASKLNLRVTVIDEKGNVLGDSEEDPSTMENHGHRLEVIRAIESGAGQSSRLSDTLGYNMKYVAVAVKDSGKLIGVVRVALALEKVESQIRFIYRVVLFGGVIAVIFALVGGYFISRNIVGPIARMKEISQKLAKGDFSKRVKIKSKDELGVLAGSLNKMADELEQKIKSLNMTDKVRTDFVANVSHELKTPLTSIKGFIETLEDGAIEDKANARKFISIIKKRAQGLENIVNDLLSLSELELGKDRLQRTGFDLRKLAEEVILGFGHALSQKKQALKQEYKGSDFYITADKVKIEQVLVNLIDNAIKYTKDLGLIKVLIREEGDRLQITVKDNGVGISPEHLGRIFERFYRVDKARSRDSAGTGLGLSIVKHIVLLHKGQVSVDSSLNKGTTITVSLPKA